MKILVSCLCHHAWRRSGDDSSPCGKRNLDSSLAGSTCLPLAWCECASFPNFLWYLLCWGYGEWRMDVPHLCTPSRLTEILGWIALKNDHLPMRERPLLLVRGLKSWLPMCSPLIQQGFKRSRLHNLMVGMNT